MDGELRRRVWWVAALLVLRLAYLGQYLKLPFVFGPLFDSQVYLAQASAVRAGQFGDATLLAFSPLYGYFLALVGPGIGDLLPLFLQLGIGIGNVLLVARITEHCFGGSEGHASVLEQSHVARAGAIAFALYGPLLLFETKLMSETLGIALLLIGVERFASPDFAAGRARAIAASGAALTLAVWARASLLFCLPFFVLAALLSPAPVSARAANSNSRLALPLRRALGLGLTIAALLCTYGTFTRWQSGLFVPVILVSNTVAQTTSTEWSGDLSAVQAEGDAPVGAFSVVEQAKQRLRALQRGEPDPQAKRAAFAGVDLLGFLRQAPLKLALTLRDGETSFDYAFYGERSEAPILYLTFATFGMIACTALVGAWLTIKERAWRALVVLLPIVLGILATTTLFHPSTRYRLPLLVAFAPLSGLAWVRAVAAYRHGARGLLALLVLVSVVFSVRGATRSLEHPGAWQLRVAEAAAMANDLPECQARVRAALSIEPDSPSVRARTTYVARLLPACIVR
jgi:hypothetical protein